MTMARWYDGDHPMTMWQLHDNDEAMLYHIIISTLSHHQHRLISTSALTEKMRSHVSRHKKNATVNRGTWSLPESGSMV